jgi:hypothetical protein
VKDGFYDDFLDTVRYFGDLFVRAELREPGTMEAETPSTLSVREPAREPWAWLHA